jgi:hypothetical protein
MTNCPAKIGHCVCVRFFDFDGFVPCELNIWQSRPIRKQFNFFAATALELLVLTGFLSQNVFAGCDILGPPPKFFKKPK